MEQEDAEDLYLTARININVADIRRENKFRSERTSQVLFNELIDVLEEGDEYSRVRCRDNFEGWIDKRFISRHDSFDSYESYVVISNLAPGYGNAEIGLRRVTSIPYGCRLYGEIEGEFIKVDSNRYGDFFVPFGNLANDKDAHLSFTTDNLIAETEKFLGAPYLWGGRSFFGIDCSGFAQCIMGRFGVELPRDSKDQRNQGPEIAREDIQPGDLLFFPRHVTIAVSDSLMIHSSLGNGGVAYNSLDPGSSIYSEYFDKNLQTIRRVLP